MDLSTLKSYQRTIASVDLPLKHFVETGFWNPYAIEGWTEHDIGDTFVRRTARLVASELKRPFIQCYSSLSIWGYRTAPHPDQPAWTQTERYKLDTPRFSGGIVQMPKRRYLAPLVAPLLLLPQWNRTQDEKSVGYSQSTATLWQFRITSEEFWNQYYEFALNDPECRQARRLTS